jgi:hypothetical protein
MAPDILSIFVAGNVLSRGLTLEGLTTSLFLRGAAEPAADTQMQMQRWFGYRGRHLPFCRVLCFDDQLELFARYHVNDNALKQRIMLQMEHSEVNDEDESTILILEGTSFVATSKVESRKIPLSPGPRPSIRLVEASDPTLGKHNLDLVADLLDEGHWVDLKDDNDLVRGRIREETVSLGQLADILDQLRYVHHDPDPALELSKRWSHYQGVLGVEKQLFRPPGLKPGPYRCEPQSCPYTIAAYLRLWEELRGDRYAHGFYPTDRPDVPWSLSDAAHQPGPRFYLAVRNGSHVPLDKRLAGHRIKAMTRQLLPRGGMLRTLWGTRGYQGTYYGDENVDYYHHRSSPLPSIQGEASWRPRGHPGLALIHVIQEASSPTDLVAIGLALPHGGPDHIAALRP